MPDHWLSIPGRASKARPFCAAKPRALASASWMLTEPELTGLMALRSRLPELVGCGKLKPGICGGVAVGIAPGKPAGMPGGGGWCCGGCCCGV